VTHCGDGITQGCFSSTRITSISTASDARSGFELPIVLELPRSRAHERIGQQLEVAYSFARSSGACAGPESSAQIRLEWIAALDKLGGLNARTVVAGHKIPDNADDPKPIAQTRQYLRDLIRLDQATDTPRERFDAMLELYPTASILDHSGRRERREARSP
jgi:hypothetical protein